MTIESLIKYVPEFAEDLKKNLVLALGTKELSAVQIWGTALAAVIACRESNAINVVWTAAMEHLDNKTVDAARGAVSIMGAHNVYWRFWYLADDKEYLEIKPEFSEEIFKKHGISDVDFEVFVLAVSSINQCSGCIKTHSRRLLKSGMSKTQIMHAVRIAAVMHSLAATMAGSDISSTL